MNPKKDILIVRVPEKFELDRDLQKQVSINIHNNFNSQFFTIVLFCENKTDKTQFEIIKT